MSNGFDPDQDQLSVGPDLGPDCLQSYQQMIEVTARKEKVKCAPTAMQGTVLCQHLICKSMLTGYTGDLKTSITPIKYQDLLFLTVNCLKIN